jgi:hypothetical protein
MTMTFLSATATAVLSLAAMTSCHVVEAAAMLPRFLNNNNNNNNNDYSYIDDDYHMVFQGCHHVQQWNDNAYEEDDVKIMTRRLVRYRLCGDCNSCNNDYGDYVVDMDDYLTAFTNSMNTVCGLAATSCGCDDNNDSDCLTTCYSDHDINYCNQQDFLKGFTGCSEIKLNNNNKNRNRALNDNNNQVRYYLGAYCAGQGGSIQLAIFTDDTCTTFADDGNALYAASYGYELPFSSETTTTTTSLISNTCKSCDPYDEYPASDRKSRELNNNNQNQNQQSFCVASYMTAGKCETKMKVDYPNESSCNYIEGIKIIRDDGVIRTSHAHQSKAAAVFIGLLTTAAVLLGAYVYFLRTKLQRAQINLHASTQGMLPGVMGGNGSNALA